MNIEVKITLDPKEDADYLKTLSELFQKLSVNDADVNIEQKAIPVISVHDMKEDKQKRTLTCKGCMHWRPFGTMGKCRLREGLVFKYGYGDRCKKYARKKKGLTVTSVKTGGLDNE